MTELTEELPGLLIGFRNKYGAESDAGGHISNLIANYEQEPDRGARERLEKFMAESVKAIESLMKEK